MSGRITYHLTRPDSDTLRMDAADGRRAIIRGADCATRGKTPAQLANALYRVAQSHLLLSRACEVTADWPFEIRPDAALWQRFRDVVAQMPRGG